MLRKNVKLDQMKSNNASFVCGVSTGGGQGSTPSPSRYAVFYTDIAEIVIIFFGTVQLAYIISRNFHCDAIVWLSNFSWALFLQQ